MPRQGFAIWVVFESEDDDAGEVREEIVEQIDHDAVVKVTSGVIDELGDDQLWTCKAKEAVGLHGEPATR